MGVRSCETKLKITERVNEKKGSVFQSVCMVMVVCSCYSLIRLHIANKRWVYGESMRIKAKTKLVLLFSTSGENSFQSHQPLAVVDAAVDGVADAGVAAAVVVDIDGHDVAAVAVATVVVAIVVAAVGLSGTCC